MNYKDEYIRRVNTGEIKTKKKKANLIKKLKTLPDNIFIAYPEELKIIDII
jgi:c-di-AMP phosphodiesterase-like protein